MALRSFWDQKAEAKWFSSEMVKSFESINSLWISQVGKMSQRWRCCSISGYLRLTQMTQTRRQSTCRKLQRISPEVRLRIVFTVGWKTKEVDVLLRFLKWQDSSAETVVRFTGMYNGNGGRGRWSRGHHRQRQQRRFWVSVPDGLYCLFGPEVSEATSWAKICPSPSQSKVLSFLVFLGEEEDTVNSEPFGGSFVAQISDVTGRK